MQCINRVFIVGRIGEKPESKLSKNGKPYAKFSVATKQYRMMPDGNKQESTEWHKVTAWGPTAKICLEKLEKGSQVFVEGELSTYSYENQGQIHLRTSIMAQKVSFMSLPLQTAPAS
jgi:single-strand DNA-binding protein